MCLVWRQPPLESLPQEWAVSWVKPVSNERQGKVVAGLGWELGGFAPL